MLRKVLRSLNGYSAGTSPLEAQELVSLTKALSKERTKVDDNSWDEITDNRLRKLILLAGITYLMPVLDMTEQMFALEAGLMAKVA